MAARPCLDCGAISGGSRCPSCRSKREKERGSSSQRGYGAEWRKLRERVLQEEPTCRAVDGIRTLRGVINYVWCNAPSEEIDHIFAKALGGSDDRSNLRAVCRYHNRSKGARVA